MASLVGYAAVGEAALELTEDATTDEGDVPAAADDADDPEALPG